MLTWTEERRALVIDLLAEGETAADSTVRRRARHRAKAAIMPPAHIGLFGESPALVRNAEGAIPPGNAQAHERQTAATCKGLRGFWRAAHGLKAGAHRRGAGLAPLIS